MNAFFSARRGAEPPATEPGAATAPATTAGVSGARVFELACQLLRAKTEALLARERRELDEIDAEFQVGATAPRLPQLRACGASR
jgi:hypothetical protein